MSLPQILQNLRVPAVAAPMFIVSNPQLVVAQCTAGMIGSFPALNARREGEFEKWLMNINDELDRYNQQHPECPAAPFAVNQIVHASNKRLEQDLELCVKYKVPIIITSLGARPEVNDAVHSYGGITLHDVINNTFAKKAIAKGADGLIAVAAGAGGHAGRISPFALIEEIRARFDGPLLLSGSIATGRSILAAQVMGADLAYIGSGFIATEEANAVEAYKEMIVNSGADDIVYTNLFSGVHGNYLKPSIQNAGLDPNNLDESDASKMDFGKERKAWKDIWSAGQGIGAIDGVVKAQDFIKRLMTEYEVAKKNVVSH